MGVPMQALAMQSLPFTICFWVGDSGLLVEMKDLCLLGPFSLESYILSRKSSPLSPGWCFCPVSPHTHPSTPLLELSF